MWRREGFTSLAAWMASKTGTPVGPAVASLEMAGLLDDLPALAAAFREGRLSEVQAREIAEVASEVPDAAEQLVEAFDTLLPAVTNLVANHFRRVLLDRAEERLG